ncbi:hypothetical protein CCR75_003965 [Bremia lactucae]|uniref:Uncharacterized protein n=1 Tax=Bremia lactucae TaxID=4779 RepID=A0A976FP21_BRELC|nr:hypothetical protein CCR75_003965 [Bremia lactucae]
MVPRGNQLLSIDTAEVVSIMSTLPASAPNANIFLCTPTSSDYGALRQELLDNGNSSPFLIRKFVWVWTFLIGPQPIFGPDATRGSCSAGDGRLSVLNLELERMDRKKR